MDAEHLAFEDESFDLICGSSILHHLDLDQSLSEIDRVLAPGGSAAFMEPLGHNFFINAYRALTPGMRTPDEHPLRRSDLAKIQERFPEAHFDFFHLTTLAAVPFRNASWFNKLLRTANAFDQKLFSTSSFLGSQAWLCNIYIEK